MKKKMLSVLAFGLVVGAGLVSCGGSSEFDNTRNITCYTRDTTSGTRDGFFSGIGLKDAAANNAPLKEGTVTVASNGEMISSLKNDVYGIGYFSLSSLATSDLKGVTYNDVVPSEANVINGTYGLTRNFNYCVRDDFNNSTVGQIVDAFLAYMFSTDGQLIIENEGGIVKTDATYSWDSVKANYPVTTQNNSSVTVRFGGSTSVQEIATALTSAFSPLCGNFVANHNHKGSGDAYKNTQGDNKDSSTGLDIGFASREFNLDTTEPLSTDSYGLICVDAIVVAANKENPIEKITDEELVDMYTGEVSTWSEIL